MRAPVVYRGKGFIAWAVAVVAFLCLTVLSCSKPTPERMLFDFESDSELDRFHWQCHTLFSLSDEHITHGKKSLKLELFPSTYPGLAPMIANNDWREFRVFSFDIYNAQHKEISMAVRIDDSRNYPDHGDRYNRTFVLRPGANTIRIGFDKLVTSGTNRKLNLRMIYRVLIFMVQPQERTVLYFDNIRLTR